MPDPKPDSVAEKVVCYYRVSTARQGESGLGLEAQREAVSRFLSYRDAVVVAEYTETESGRRSNRPELEAALGVCRKKRATLVIAKLDRLARNVHFISGLLESGVNFLAADQPTKDRFMLHIQAAFAEEEARKISVRTKEALAAAKRRGVDIGATGRKLAKRHRAEAMKKAESYLGIVRVVRAGGAKTTKEVMEELNRREVLTPGGSKTWHYSNTYKLLKRLEEQYPV